MGFSDDLRSGAADIWAKEQTHPFVKGIGDGSLPLEKFRHYMRQDYVFLIDFCRVISLAVTKTPNVDDMGWFARLLHETLNTEMALHVSFCGDFGVSEEELRTTVASPTTRAYTRHMLQTAFAGSAVDIAAVILPCSWGYCEIGQDLKRQGSPENAPLYGRWIETYASQEFAELAEWLRGYIDRTAAECSPVEQARMEQAFLISSRYEYMFWDAAYRLEAWPV